LQSIYGAQFHDGEMIMLRLAITGDEILGFHSRYADRTLIQASYPVLLQKLLDDTLGLDIFVFLKVSINSRRPQ
jgi:hypothetical protein